MTNDSKMYVFDEKRVNEQACCDQAVARIRTGDATRIEIHKHGVDDPCVDSVIDLKVVKEQQELSHTQCYAFTAETVTDKRP